VGGRRGVEPCERPPPSGGEAHEALPGVAGRGLPVDEAVLHEPAQDATQIPRVEAQLPAQLRRRRLVALRQLVQYARRGERERAVQEPFVERSEEHTSELQSRSDLVCRLLLEKKKKKTINTNKKKNKTHNK